MGMYTYVPRWISDESFNGKNSITATVTDAKIETKDNGKVELVIWMTTEHEEKCRMSIWGKNNQYFATKLGDGTSWDTDKLVNRKVRITKETVKDKVQKHVALE